MNVEDRREKGKCMLREREKETKGVYVFGIDI
jgi:hypothetical protein